MFGVSLHILRGRGLAAPDGRPLCRYAVTDDELRALIDGLARAALDPRLHAADFCLLAAEAWRRRYDGGHWTWDVVLPCVPSTPPSTRDLARLVTTGLRAWRRPVLQLARLEYLGSIAREAGLPSLVLQRESGRIRAFLKALIADLRTFGDRHALDLARQHAGRLPDRLQNPTFFAISADAATAAIALATSLADTTTSSAPLTPADLDRHAPTWRDRFPLRLDDAAALALVTGLVDTARAAPPRRPLRARVRLTRFPNDPRLQRTLELPATLAAADLAALVGLPPGALPARADLIHTHPRGVTTLAHLVRRLTRDADTYAVESLADLRATADAPLTLALRAHGDLLGHFIPPGGEALSDLPWVFTPDPATDHDWRLVAQGATRFATTAVALAPPAWRPDAPLTPAATLHGRHAYHLDATTTFTGPDAALTLRAGAPPGDDSYALIGPRLPHALDTDVFLGLPTLHAVSPDGHARRVPPDRLLVATATGWRPAASATPRGRLRLRALDAAGAPVFEGRAACLPPNTRVELTPTSLTGGLIRVTHADAPLIGVPPTPGLTATLDDTAPDTLAVDAPNPPARLALHLRWPNGDDLTLALPFPRRGRRFVRVASDDLADLGPGARVPLADLYTVTAEAWPDRPTPRPLFALEATLDARDVPRTSIDLAWLTPDRAAGHRHALALHAVARALDRLFALSTVPDATIRLRIRDALGGHAGAPALTVARFALTVAIDKHAGVATLAAPDAPLPPDVAALALRIADPDTVVPLPRADAAATAAAATVDLAPLADRPGSWMVFAAVDDRPVSAPRLRIIPGAPEPPASTLAAAVDLSRHADRARAFRAAWHHLATHPDDPGWPLVYAWLARLDRFPITTFEGLRVLPDVPLALARALLSADPAALVRAIDALPFHWATLPAAALTGALRLTRDHLAALIGDPALAAAALIDVARAALDALAASHPAAAVLAAAATRDLPDLAPAFPCPELALAAASPAAFLPPLSAALTELRQRHPDLDAWPRPRALDALLDAAPPPPATHAALAALPEQARPVALAPLLAAACAASGHRPAPAEAYALRLAEAFDPTFFAAALPIALTLALARTPS